MAKFPTIEEFVQQVKERVLAECLIDGEPLGELIDSGDLVHVCRCKDCASFDAERWWCSRIGIGIVHSERSFCSWAKPKETTEEVRKQLKDMEQRREMDRKK